jgi:hypothetical protein
MTPLEALKRSNEILMSENRRLLKTMDRLERSILVLRHEVNLWRQREALRKRKAKEPV